MPNSYTSAYIMHALSQLLFEKRAALAAAYHDADVAAHGSATGTLTTTTWDETTASVLGIHVPLCQWFGYVLRQQRAAGGVAEGHVQHAPFLARFTLRVPGLTPLYSVRHEMLALLERRMDADGDVTMEEFEACCATLHTHEPAAAELCQPPARLLAACGPIAESWVESGSVSVGEFRGCFAVIEQAS